MILFFLGEMNKQIEEILSYYESIKDHIERTIDNLEKLAKQTIDKEYANRLLEMISLLRRQLIFVKERIRYYRKLLRSEKG